MACQFQYVQNRMIMISIITTSQHLMRLRVHGIRIHVLARVHVHGVHALVPLDDKRLEAIESRLLDILDWYKLN